MKLTDQDQDIYRDFSLTISERLVPTNIQASFSLKIYSFRWQQEITETVFESVNQEVDRLEKKNKAKKLARFYDDEKESDCILQGYIKKRGQSFASGWQIRYAKLYPNR